MSGGVREKKKGEGEGKGKSVGGGCNCGCGECYYRRDISITIAPFLQGIYQWTMNVEPHSVKYVHTFIVHWYLAEMVLLLY